MTIPDIYCYYILTFSALAVPTINGVEKDPVLVKKNHHLGRYKTVWHYKYVDQSKPHGIIGDFQDFPFTP